MDYFTEQSSKEAVPIGKIVEDFVAHKAHRRTSRWVSNDNYRAGSQPLRCLSMDRCVDVRTKGCIKQSICFILTRLFETAAAVEFQLFPHLHVVYIGYILLCCESGSYFIIVV